MPRLGHKKSRTGCRQCKARHVKCDESKPCSNCARHGVLCSLVDPNAPLPVPAAGAASNNIVRKASTTLLVERFKEETPSGSSSSSQALPADSTLELPDEDHSPLSGSDSFPFLNKFLYRRNNHPSNLWLKDLELMHHWVTNTAYTLSQRVDNKHLWTHVAPKEGIQHTFLMHEILAVSALHLALAHPEKHSEYFALGTHHQDHALRGLRKNLGHITEENASALFGTSTLITDLQAVPSDTASVFDDVADVFALVMGMGGVMAAGAMMLWKGPFGILLRDPLYETRAQPMFPKLLERMPKLLHFLEKECDLEETQRKSLCALAAVMRDTILRNMRPCMENREVGFLFYWPLHMSSDFLTALREKNEPALVLLAHWTVVLYAAEPLCWFLKGWSDRVIRAISEAVTDPVWRSAIEWPLQFLERQRSSPPIDPGLIPEPPVYS